MLIAEIYNIFVVSINLDIYLIGNGGLCIPIVPAFCDNCGGVFPSGVFVENSTNITLGNISAGPCPFCGRMGHIPDEIYNFIGNTIELLTGPKRTIKELNKLKDIITNSKEKGLMIDSFII